MNGLLKCADFIAALLQQALDLRQQSDGLIEHGVSPGLVGADANEILGLGVGREKKPERLCPLQVRLAGDGGHQAA